MRQIFWMAAAALAATVPTAAMAQHRGGGHGGGYGAHGGWGSHGGYGGGYRHGGVSISLGGYGYGSPAYFPRYPAYYDARYYDYPSYQIRYYPRARYYDRHFRPRHHRRHW